MKGNPDFLIGTMVAYMICSHPWKTVKSEYGKHVLFCGTKLNQSSFNNDLSISEHSASNDGISVTVPVIRTSKLINHK
jgi:hypothetical protein